MYILEFKANSKRNEGLKTHTHTHTHKICKNSDLYTFPHQLNPLAGTQILLPYLCNDEILKQPPLRAYDNIKLATMNANQESSIAHKPLSTSLFN